LPDELVSYGLDGPTPLALGSDEAPQMNIARAREFEPVALFAHATTGLGDWQPLVVEPSSGCQDALVIARGT
jgi:hypothetical protein